MTALFIIYGPAGIIGQCDAVCYDSDGGLCGCICGGANHGAGRRRAIRNTYKHALTWLDRVTLANPDVRAADILPRPAS